MRAHRACMLVAALNILRYPIEFYETKFRKVVTINFKVSFAVFGQPDFAKTLVSNSPVLGLLVVSSFGADGFDML